MTLEQLSAANHLNFSLNKPEFVRSIFERNIPAQVLDDIRTALFQATQSVGLAERRASIVSRRGTGLNPLPRKLSEDIWVLADCIMSNKPVKCIMYKGGKRGISYLETEWNSKDASDNVGLVQDNVNEYTASIDNNVNENITVDQPQNNTASLPATMRIEPELSPRDTNSSHSDVHLVSEIERL